MPSPVPGPQPQVVNKAQFMETRQQAAGHHHNAGCWANRAAAHAAAHAAAPATLHTCVRQPSPHALSPTTAPPGTLPPHISFIVRCLFAGGPASSSSSSSAAASTRCRRRGSGQTMRYHGQIRMRLEGVGSGSVIVCGSQRCAARNEVWRGVTRRQSIWRALITRAAAGPGGCGRRLRTQRHPARARLSRRSIRCGLGGCDRPRCRRHRRLLVGRCHRHWPLNRQSKQVVARAEVTVELSAAAAAATGRGCRSARHVAVRHPPNLT